MREEEIERALAQYRESLGKCERVPQPSEGRALWPRRLAIGLAGTAALVVCGVAFWPQDARAAALRRMNQAIRDAKTMEIVFTVERPKGKWWTLSHMYYRDGMWRFETEKSAALANTTIVKNGQELIDYHRLDHASLQIAKDDPLFEETKEGSALEFAKRLLDSGRTSIEKSVRISGHPPVAGRETYVIEMERIEDHYRAELVVDKATDLPIYGEATLDQTSGLGHETVSYRQEYRFNHPMPDRLFSFDIDKPVVDISKARENLKAEWSKPFAQVSGADVRYVGITPDGTVWVATGSAKSAIMPDVLTSEQGDVYTREADYCLSGDSGDPLEVDGRILSVTPFINMNPESKLPRRFTLTFAHRPTAWADFPPTLYAGGSVTVKPTIVADRSPQWLSVIAGDRQEFELSLQAWNARAKQFEADQMFQLAAKAYERCAEEYKHFIKRGAYFPLTSAARCYLLAGDIFNAHRVSQQAEIVRLKKER